MQIRTVVADDEILARQKLRQLLKDEPDIEVIGEGATGQETLDLVHLTKPDLLLLDIQMPGIDGFDIISALAETTQGSMPRIIFTTAYDRYALKAFEIHAVDYLLKPFTRERLRCAIEHARAQMQLPDGSDDKKTARNATTDSYTERIVFKSKGRILFLPVEEIRWIAAEENYVRLCTGRESHLLRDTMTRFETRLDPRMFIRVHRSAIVNLKYVKEIRTDNPESEAIVLLADGQKVAVSRSYRARISELIAR